MDHRSATPSVPPPARRLRLASTSPRRRLLLPLLGLPVELVDVAIDERPLPGELPHQTAIRLALAKASAAATIDTSVATLGADTIVVLDGQQLAKPGDAAEARTMLCALRGRTHEVVTGVALLANGRRHLGAVQTRVTMRDYADVEIERYVASGRPLDKAGGYAIQDTDFAPVAMIQGCYLNVVGLPLCEVGRGLARLGWTVAEAPVAAPCRLCEQGAALLRASASSQASASEPDA